MIESSFLKQYGIRLRKADDLSFEEFCSLLSGIMPETPLGRIASIRAEKDSKILKNFTEEQMRIRMEWQQRRWKQGGRSAGNNMLLAMQQQLKEAYGS